MYIFAADIHLRPGNLEDEARLKTWLESLPAARRIFILGDLFDYWYSGLEDRIPHVMALLADPRITIMPGNRDFLLFNLSGSGLDILREEELVTEVLGRRVLLAHGHTLPRADYGFKLLHRVGWPIIRFADRHLGLTAKHHLAERMVKTSAVLRPLDAEIPGDLAVRKGVDLIICGHLHRKIQTANLLVLPPFQDCGEYAVWDHRGISFRTVSRPA